MAPRPFSLQALRYNTEATWGENVSTFANRLQVTATLDPSGLKHEMIPSDPVVQRQNDGRQDFRGIMSGEFTLELDLTGRGSSSAGAVSITDLAQFIGYCVGGAPGVASSSVAAAAGTTLLGTGDADTLNLAASAADFARGSLCRVGALGDGRGGGQFYAVDTDAADVAELLTGMAAAGAAADVVYAPDMVWPLEDPDDTEITAMRFEMLSENQSFEAHGCFCTGLSFTGLATGERPKVSATFTCSWWANTSGTFPTATAEGNTAAATPVAAGSFFYADVGTTTRQTADIRGFALTIDLATHPLMGPGGVNQHQAVVGAHRSKCQAQFEFIVDGDDTGWDSWWDTDENSITPRHMLYTLSAADGRAVGMYFPKVYPVGPRPTQIDNEGLNARKIMCRAVTGPTTATDLLMSNWRLALA